MGLLECGGVPVLAGGEEHLLSAGDLSEELFACGSLEHSDAYGAEVIDTLEDRAGGYMAAAVEHATALVERADIVVDELTEYVDIEGLRVAKRQSVPSTPTASMP